LPKFLCWKIWLAWNKKKFNNERCNPLQTTLNVVSLLSKHLQSRNKTQDQKLDSMEKAWLSQFKLDHIGISHIKDRVTSFLHWMIRKEPSDFLAWKTRQHSFTLFFDGASKNNQEVAGAGGISMILEETRLSTMPGGLETSQTILLRLTHCGGASSSQRKKVLEH
jgi:hypothetical protein